MSDDFVTRLRLELRDAAAREERRGPLRRAARAVRWQPAGPVAAVGAVVVAIVALVITTGMRDGETEPAQTGPRVVRQTDLTSQGGVAVSAFGSVWTVDPAAGELLRIDPARRRTVARIPVGGSVALDAGAGAMWAVNADELLRIDPAAGRVGARLPLGQAPQFVDVRPGRGVMWVLTGTELLRIDPRRMAVERRLALAAGGFLTVGAAWDGRDLYIARGDGVLRTFDGATGERLTTVRAGAEDFLVAAAGGNAIYAGAGGVRAVDPATGREAWRRQLPLRRVNNAVPTPTSLWIHGSTPAGADRLWRLDRDSGAITASVALPDFGAAGMTRVGDRLWIVTDGGRLLEVE